VSPQQIAWTLLKDPENARSYLEELCRRSSEIASFDSTEICSHHSAAGCNYLDAIDSALTITDANAEAGALRVACASAGNLENRFARKTMGKKRIVIVGGVAGGQRARRA
jgi:Ni2+-binding GTPase involved in maturation of urease and hydrogenase